MNGKNVFAVTKIINTDKGFSYETPHNVENVVDCPHHDCKKKVEVLYCLTNIDLALLDSSFIQKGIKDIRPMITEFDHENESVHVKHSNDSIEYYSVKMFLVCPQKGNIRVPKKMAEKIKRDTAIKIGRAHV